MVKYAIRLIAAWFTRWFNSASILVEPGTAAIQNGRLREAIGIKVLGVVFTPMLKKGWKVPCSIAQTFSTADDGQTQISLHLCRGNAALAQGTHFLGTFQITGIPPMRPGEASIRVEFKVDAGGIRLKATDNHGKARLSLARVAS